MHSECSHEISIIGIGSTGSRIADKIKALFPHSSCKIIAADTDSGELDKIRHASCIIIAEEWQKGRNCAADIQRGERVTAHEVDRFRDIMSETRWTIAIGSLAGGTGAGGLLTLNRIASDHDHPFLAIGIEPYQFEGSALQENANRAITQLSHQHTPLLVIPNEFVLASVPEDLPLPDILDQANKLIAEAITTFIIALGAQDSLFQGADILLHLLRQRQVKCGCVALNAIAPESPETVIREALESPLLGDPEFLKQADTHFASIIAHPGTPLKPVRQTAAILNRLLPQSARSYINLGSHDSVPAGLLNIFILSLRQIGTRPQQSEGATHLLRRQAGVDAINLGPGVLGIFANSTPTIYGGENLDIPTFFRKGITINLLLEEIRHIQSKRNDG
ncbi:MAG: hypothetical protein D6820_09460 [Lentisphaerae bacterium]|nr:MAG: hypothetical protein D6820_09460 [Lentisphaerota bacterium]